MSMDKTSSNPEMYVNVPWDELAKLENEMNAAADRLEIKNSQHFRIIGGGSNRGASVRIAAGGRIASKENIAKPPLIEEKINVDVIQDDKSEKAGVMTAEVGTQTESMMEKEDSTLVSYCSFAPYSLKNGMQIKCIQVKSVKLSEL